MSAQLEPYQPNYDSDIKEKAYLSALQNAIISKATELHSDSEKKERFKHVIIRAKYQAQILKDQIASYNDHINKTLEYHSQLSAYEGYDLDLTINSKALLKREDEYTKQFENLPLISLGEDGKILHPRNWRLDKSEVKDLDPFIPHTTRLIHTEKVKKSKEVIVKYPGMYNYQNTTLRYADNGEVIRNRHLLFWRCYDEKRVTSPGVIQTDASGNIKNIHYDYQVFNFKGERYDQAFLDKPLIPRMDGIYRGFSASKGSFKLIKPIGGIMLPLDQGPFLAKPIEELRKLERPNYLSKDNGTKIAFEGDKEKPDILKENIIHVHCTLPEWNSRLRRALNDLNQQVKEYSILKAPHEQKIKELLQMQTYVELHIKHPFKDNLNSIYNSADHQKNVETRLDLPQREELSKAIGDLIKGIDGVANHPLSGQVPTDALYFEKKHIDEMAKELWELLSSPALRAEIEFYTEHCKNNPTDGNQQKPIFDEYKEERRAKSNGCDWETWKEEVIGYKEVPAGPYTEYEPLWQEIFMTIAECYAALKASDVYSQIAWDEDLSVGLEYFSKMSPEVIIDEEIRNIWNYFYSDPEKKRRYIENQLDTFDHYLNEDESEPDKKSLFHTIIANYETYAKDHLGHIMPAPGAPPTLQVIINLYQPNLIQYMSKKIKDDSVFHIKVFAKYLLFFNMVNSKGKITGNPREKLNSLFQAFIVTNDKRSDSRLAAKTHNSIKKYILTVANVDDEGKIGGKVYSGLFKSDNPLINTPQTIASSLYAVFNLTLSLQTAIALEEQADQEDWTVGEYYIAYTNAMAQVALGIGTSTNNMLNMLTRIKFLGLSAARETGWTSKLITSFDSGFLSKFLNSSAVLVGIIATVTSTIQTLEHLEEGDIKSAFVSALGAISSFMLSSGTLIHMFVATSAIASAFIVVGSIISLGFLIYDLGNMIKSSLATDSQKELVRLWSEFKNPVPVPNSNALKKTGLILEKQQFTRNGKLIGQSSLNPIYSSQKKFWDLYPKHPFEGIYNNESIWSDKSLTVEPCKKIERLYETEFLSIKDWGVELGFLNWQAVVPLHLLNYDLDFIETAVKFKTLPKHKRYEYDKRLVIKTIIDYYKIMSEKTACTATSELKYDNSDLVIKVTSDGVDKDEPISNLLEAGIFLPPKNQSYFKSDFWEQPILIEA